MRLKSLTPHLKSTGRNGFTIVELLIVIVVIGILTAIVVTSYNGIQRQAWNVNRLAELKHWEELFDIYYGRNGEYPAHPESASENFYCLGRNFPSNACWNPYGGLVKGLAQPVKYADDGILTALETVDTLPKGPRWGIGGGPGREMGDGVGPIVEYRNGKAYSIWNFYYGECPKGTKEVWTDINSSRCEIKLK